MNMLSDGLRGLFAAASGQSGDAYSAQTFDVECRAVPSSAFYPLYEPQCSRWRFCVTARTTRGRPLRQSPGACQVFHLIEIPAFLRAPQNSLAANSSWCSYHSLSGPVGCINPDLRVRAACLRICSSHEHHRWLVRKIRESSEPGAKGRRQLRANPIVKFYFVIADVCCFLVMRKSASVNIGVRIVCRRCGHAPHVRHQRDIATAAGATRAHQVRQ
jgi:hypothetical protein